MATETEIPFVINRSQLRTLYTNVEEENENGSITPLKMRASVEFLFEFNARVYHLLYDCIERARQRGRKALEPEDLDETPRTFPMG